MRAAVDDANDGDAPVAARRGGGRRGAGACGGDGRAADAAARAEETAARGPRAHASEAESHARMDRIIDPKGPARACCMALFVANF